MKLEILADQLVQSIKKMVYSKTSTQEEMFREKIFYRKCFCRVIRRGDENSSKHDENSSKHLNNFNKVAGI